MLSGGHAINVIEKATVVDYHRHRIDTFDRGSVESLGWRDHGSQIKRFEVLAGIGDLNGCSLLDVGCGYGDLKGFLDPSCSIYTYVGIDHMPEFITVAKKRYAACDNTYFFQADFNTATFPQVDYVLASGALSYRCASPQFYQGMIIKMYDAATKAIAFNMLHGDRFPDHPLLLGHDPQAIASFCKSLSPYVEVIEGYLPDDFTVFVYKPPRVIGP
jgi:SAM-dependent methyltransferase